MNKLKEFCDLALAMTLLAMPFVVYFYQMKP
jgi:hypothetical protein